MCSLYIPVYRRAFSMFDYQKCGEIETDKIRTILITLGNPYDEAELERLIRQEDTEGMLNADIYPSAAVAPSAAVPFELGISCRVT